MRVKKYIKKSLLDSNQATQKKGWGDDEELIQWAWHYFNTIPETARLPSDRKYINLIKCGYNSQEAQSGELQKELKWIRTMVKSVAVHKNKKDPENDNLDRKSEKS